MPSPSLAALQMLGQVLGELCKRCREVLKALIGAVLQNPPRAPLQTHPNPMGRPFCWDSPFLLSQKLLPPTRLQPREQVLLPCHPAPEQRHGKRRISGGR